MLAGGLARRVGFGWGDAIQSPPCRSPSPPAGATLTARGELSIVIAGLSVSAGLGAHPDRILLKGDLYG
jgi:hypothetical protein